MSAYTAAIERNLRGIEHFSTGPCPGCAECGLEEYADLAMIHDDSNAMDAYDIAAEGDFSWSACESCGSTFGGSRFPAHGYIDGELAHFHVCSDCLMYHANGEEPEDWQPHPRTSAR